MFLHVQYQGFVLESVRLAMGFLRVCAQRMPNCVRCDWRIDVCGNGETFVIFAVCRGVVLFWLDGDFTITQ